MWFRLFPPWNLDCMSFILNVTIATADYCVIYILPLKSWGFLKASKINNSFEVLLFSLFFASSVFISLEKESRRWVSCFVGGGVIRGNGQIARRKYRKTRRAAGQDEKKSSRAWRKGEQERRKTQEKQKEQSA